MAARSKSSVPGAPRKIDSTCEWLLERLLPLGDTTVRAMFGGFGVYAGDVMFGIVYRGVVYLKTDAKQQANMTRRGLEPFSPKPGMVLKSYYALPADVLEDDALVLEWAKRAVVSAAARADRFCDPEEILKPAIAKIRAVANRLRRLVLAEVPEAEEAGYPGWRLIGYRAPSYFCFVAPLDDHVRLGFEHGAKLDDPDGLLEGSGKQVRYVVVRPGVAPDAAALRALIRRAHEAAARKRPRLKSAAPSRAPTRPSRR